MPNIKFTKLHHQTSDLHFWTWRGLNRQLEFAKRSDEAQASEFCERALAIRDQVEFLLGGGLSEGAETALSALAEQDMVDFCIMVDLAEPIQIPKVTPLPKATRKQLALFLDKEPWHSLSVDNDITVAIALLDKIGAQPTNQPWYRYAPGLMDFSAQLLDQVNKEQLLRLVGEYNVLAERDHLQLQEDVMGVMDVLIKQAAQRLGIPVPTLS